MRLREGQEWQSAWEGSSVIRSRASDQNIGGAIGIRRRHSDAVDSSHGDSLGISRKASARKIKCG